MRRTVLALISCCAAATALADPVTIRYGFDAGGDAAAMRAYVTQAHAIQKRLNPNGKTELWMDVFHGDNVGGGSVIVHYPNLAAFADAMTRNQNSEEWAAHMAKRPATMTLRYSGLSNTLWQEDDYGVATGGEVMAIFGVDIASGDASNLVAQAQRAAALQERLGIDSTFRVSAPMAAGPNTGSATVLVRYPSAAAWGEAVAKLAASEEWQAFLESFPADQYPGAYQGMSTAAPI